ncbi:MAG: hypothetical protein QXQ68_08700 [Candidatus Nitrosocaldaceae archaeon]
MLLYDMLKEFVGKEEYQLGAMCLFVTEGVDCTYDRFKVCQLMLYMQYMIKNIDRLSYFDYERAIRLINEVVKENREELIRKFEEGVQKYGVVQYLEEINVIKDPLANKKETGVKNVLNKLMYAMLRHGKKYLTSNSLDDKMGVVTNALMILQIIIIHNS